MDDPAQENVHIPGEPPINPNNNRPRNPRVNNNTTPVNINRFGNEKTFSLICEFLFILEPVNKHQRPFVPCIVL